MNNININAVNVYRELTKKKSSNNNSYSSKMNPIIEQNTFAKSFLDNLHIDNNPNYVSKDQTDFRDLCLIARSISQTIPLPKVKKNSDKEAVFIEFRVLPHTEFIIHNTIDKLAKHNWSFTIVCGNDNFNFYNEMIRRMNCNIKIIKIPISNIDVSKYNELLTNENFWNMFSGNKIFIYQEDTILLKDNIDDFIEYDYIGAPFPNGSYNTPNNVGNGGFSIRSKHVMIAVIKKINIKKISYGTSTLQYMHNKKLTVPPEDVYFSSVMQKFRIGKVAPYKEASLFASEAIYNPLSCGYHKIWLGNPNWKEILEPIFNIVYVPKSNLKSYLIATNNNIMYDFDTPKWNYFDIDLDFFKHMNDLHDKSNIELMDEFIKRGMKGLIYHPQQIYNIYPTCRIIKKNNELLIAYNGLNTVTNFINKYIRISYDNLRRQIIKNVSNLIDKTLNILIIVFIGNEKRGLEIIEKIINFKKYNSRFNIAFCFNKYTIMNNEIIKKKIKNNFKNYSIFISKNLGTDITSTLFMYDYITKCLKYTPKHIYKLHTKSIEPDFSDLTEFLLNKSLEDLLTYKRSNSNCIGNPNFLTHIVNDDIFNNDLKIEFKRYLNMDSYFVSGTIFYTDSETMNSVLDFIKSNDPKIFYLNNLYENNSMNINYSPIHFLERLFGCIKVPFILNSK